MYGDEEAVLSCYTAGTLMKACVKTMKHVDRTSHSSMFGLSNKHIEIIAPSYVELDGGF